MKTTEKPTLADRLRSAVLRGRKVALTDTQAQPPPPMTEGRAVSTLKKFSDILERLETSRAEADRANAAIAEGEAADLAALVDAGKPLPKLGSLRAAAEDSAVEVAALKAAADAMAGEAGRAISRLREVSAERLDGIELRLRTENALPAWLDPQTAESAIRSLPGWAVLADFRHRLTISHRPQIPAVLAGPGGQVVLPPWRIAPQTAADKARGPLGKRDSWNPAALAGACKRYLATAEEIRTAAEG